MRAFMNLRVSTKLLLAFALMAVVSLAAGAIIYQQKSHIQSATHWSEHTYKVLADLDDLMSAMVDRETGIRGYIITGNTASLGPYEAGNRLFAEKMAHVRQLTSDNPAQQARLGELESLSRGWEEAVGAKVRQLMAKAETRDDAAKIERDGVGKRFVDSFRDKLGEIERIERSLLATRATEVSEALGMTTTAIIVNGALMVGLAALGALLMSLAVSRPLGAMTQAMTQVAGGNLDVVVPALGQKDEVGQLAGALEKFKEAGMENRRLQAEQKEVEARAESEKRAAMNKMADDFEASVKGIVQTVSSASTELQTTAKSMTSTAEETSRQSTAVAAASEQASTNVQTVASAAEELSSSIAEIGRQVSESAQIAGQAATQAQTTNTQIKGLAEAAQRIGDVVKLINDIASQTNLLALNATIEAARAGEAGKGFAVVASEVKSLANQTAKATEEISAKISEMQAATGQSVDAIGAITQTVSRINEIATTIAAAVEQQGAATQEIARNVQQASAGTSEVNANIGGVTKAATETGAAASQVLASSGELAKQSETLSLKVDTFIATIRAA